MNTNGGRGRCCQIGALEMNSLNIKNQIKLLTYIVLSDSLNVHSTKCHKTNLITGINVKYTDIKEYSITISFHWLEDVFEYKIGSLVPDKFNSGRAAINNRNTCHKNHLQFEKKEFLWYSNDQLKASLILSSVRFFTYIDFVNANNKKTWITRNLWSIVSLL